MNPGDKNEGLLLGKHTPLVEQYSPQLLHPIPRSIARDSLGFAGQLPFSGVDLWHAYEMSWLDGQGKPVSRVGRFHVPASSPNMVESKSFKLYLNSFNSTRFASADEVEHTICADVSLVTGSEVGLELLGVDDPSLAGQALAGTCLDGLPASACEDEPAAAMLRVAEGEVEERLYSHLLRSLCPVTGQPDWATVWIHYRGLPLARETLLQYILAYRQHQEFHEQCVERMFRDIHSACQPGLLEIQAFYTRRGGLDINPFRSTERGSDPLPRLNRQ